MGILRIINLIAIVLIAFGLSTSCNKNEPEISTDTPFKQVNAFIINDEGMKLLATENGLYSLNEPLNKYEFMNTGIEIDTYNDLAYSKYASRNDLWIASNSGALNKTTQALLTTSNSGLHNNVVNNLYFGPNEISYFATPNGISILSGEEWIKNIGFDSLYLKFAITDLATASNGFTYVTTNGGGVERFKVDVDGISGATVFDTDWSKLESNNVFTIFIDDTVQAYGTDYGVAIHYSEFTKWDWENYTTRDGLINDTVLSITKDNSNNWWFGTIGGLSKFDGTIWTNYTVETDEMIGNKIKFLAIDFDGSLWFASDEGLSHYMNGKWTNY